MKLLLVTIALFVITESASVNSRLRDQRWNSFKKQFNKHYKSVGEENVRRAIYEQNVDHIQKHNVQAENGVHSFFLGVNPFSDMTNREFVASRNGYQMSERVQQTNDFHYTEEDIKNLPESVDWRTKGYVTDVKDQGSCGSCWAFSAVASLEGQHKNSTGQLVSLSEQDLVDCSFLTYGNLGCFGGQMDNAFKYIKEKGLDTEQSYPYTGKPFQSCKASSGKVGAKISGFVDLPKGDEKALQLAVATIGPISVAIDASQPTFQAYKTGVYSDLKCSSETLDHGVTVVGYGSENGKDYWIVKNSWNASWGESGYIRMARNAKNQCGIASQPSYPLATSN